MGAEASSIVRRGSRRAVRSPPDAYATASFSALMGRARTPLLAGFAANFCFSFVNGLIPSRAGRAGFFTTTNFAKPGKSSSRSATGAGRQRTTGRAVRPCPTTSLRRSPMNRVPRRSSPRSTRPTGTRCCSGFTRPRRRRRVPLGSRAWSGCYLATRRSIPDVSQGPREVALVVKA
jgi:hypothetical protein